MTITGEIRRVREKSHKPRYARASFLQRAIYIISNPKRSLILNNAGNTRRGRVWAEKERGDDRIRIKIAFL